MFLLCVSRDIALQHILDFINSKRTISDDDSLVNIIWKKF